MKTKFIIIAVLSIFGCSSLPEHQRAMETYNYKPRDSAPIGTVVPVGEELVNDIFLQYQDRYKREVDNCSSVDSCISLIKTRISQRWRLPNSFNGGDNVANFSLRINKDGILTSLILVASTGDLGFDFSCKEAIFGSSPFPKFPNLTMSDWDPEESIAIVFGPVK